ncbi:MAG: hypothetical protein ACRC1K_12320 [Planctomycetia bacterium]
MNEIPWNPTDRQLRQFGWLCLPVLPLLCWWFGGPAAVVAVGGAAGAVIAAVSVIRPRLLGPVFVASCVIAWPIGRVVGEATTAAVYFLVVTPTALTFRLIGRDALDRRLRPEAASYWRPRPRTTDARRYFRQF